MSERGFTCDNVSCHYRTHGQCHLGECSRLDKAYMLLIKMHTHMINQMNEIDNLKRQLDAHRDTCNEYAKQLNNFLKQDLAWSPKNQPNASEMYPSNVLLVKEQCKECQDYNTCVARTLSEMQRSAGESSEQATVTARSKEYAEWKNIIIHRFLDGVNGDKTCKDLHESLIAAGLPEWFYKEFEKESGTTILPF